MIRTEKTITASSVERLFTECGMFIQRMIDFEEGWEVVEYELANRWKFWEEDVYEAKLKRFYPIDWDGCDG